jgi:hypothetical protein
MPSSTDTPNRARQDERDGLSGKPLELPRAELHAGLRDPLLDSMNFLNEVVGRYPGAISFAPGRPYRGLLDATRIGEYLKMYGAHLRDERGYTATQVQRPSLPVRADQRAHRRPDRPGTGQRRGHPRRARVGGRDGRLPGRHCAGPTRVVRFPQRRPAGRRALLRRHRRGRSAARRQVAGGTRRRHRRHLAFGGGVVQQDQHLLVGEPGAVQRGPIVQVGGDLRPGDAEGA